MNLPNDSISYKQIRAYVLIILLITLSSLLFAEPVRDFTLPDINNRPVSLYDFVGDNIIFVFFWTGKCAPCLNLMAELEKVQTQYSDIEVIGVNIDYPRMVDRAKSYIRSQRYTFTALFDNNMQVARQFQVTTTNHSFILGFNGEIIHEQIGFSRSDLETMMNLIEQYRKRSLQHRD